jgi:dTDP-L-rhamnose 4-epimerase
MQRGWRHFAWFGGKQVSDRAHEVRLSLEENSGTRYIVSPPDRILVTGGAGFIGSHTVDALLERGYRVRILDSLQPRVHPNGKPEWVPSEAEFIQGDVANPADLAQALESVDAVFHLAAYQDYLPEFSKFVHTNTESSALLFELAVSNPKRFPVKKIVFASSQAVCGEGRYLCTGGKDISLTGYERQSIRPKRLPPAVAVPAGQGHGVALPPGRSLTQLERGDWEIRCQFCGLEMEPLLIDESTANPHTAYGISKYAIEKLANQLGPRYGIATVCMRYTYVQGPRNSFHNAYSGIARRFAMRIMHGMPPVVYEDGNQLRDYVNVRDIARANVLVMEKGEADYQVFNVGGGKAVTVLEFAHLMLKAYDSRMEPLVPGEFRVGDTRHTVSDISPLQRLGWNPIVPVEQNVRQYIEWLDTQTVSEEFLLEAERVMRQSGVVRTVGCAAR